MLHRHALKTLFNMGLAMSVALITAADASAQSNERFTCTLPDDAGGTNRSAALRIVGGASTDWRDWPWQVLLASPSGQGFCGGSIIASQWVLTAAHCVQDKRSSDMLIRHGETRVLSGGTAHRIANVHVHPRYNRSTVENDIALVKLERPIPNLGPEAIVQLQSETVERVFAPVGACAVVTGWGHTTHQGTVANTLQQVDVPIISPELCRSLYHGRTNEQGRALPPIHPTNVCAGYLQGIRDSCNGDSGGPLVVPDPIHPSGWTQTGITSWGDRCASANSPGVYTRVAPYIAWIDTTIRSN